MAQNAQEGIIGWISGEFLVRRSPNWQGGIAAKSARGFLSENGSGALYTPSFVPRGCSKIGAGINSSVGAA